MTPKEVAQIILDKDAILENRAGGMYNWLGWKIPCSWEERELVKQTLIEALKALTFQENSQNGSNRS